MQISRVLIGTVVGFVAASLAAESTDKVSLNYGTPQVLNASIAQVLGYDYVEALDYSALWYGVGEAVAKGINDLNIDPNAHESEIADGILRMVYGGDYIGISQEEIDELLREVQQKLAQIDKMWDGRLVDTANTPRKRETVESVAEFSDLHKRNDVRCEYSHTVENSVCRGFYDDFVNSDHTSREKYRGACNHTGRRGRCCVSWLSQIRINSVFFKRAWEPCRDTCFNRKKVSCLIKDVQGDIDGGQRASVLFSDRLENYE